MELLISRTADIEEGLRRDALKELYGTYKKLDIDKDSPDAKRIEYLFYSIKGRGQ